MATSNKVVYTGTLGRAEIFNTTNIPADIFGSSGDDYIFANSFVDYIEGGIDEDFIRGLGGNDIIFGDESAGGLNGATVGSLTSEADVILGGTGDDVIFAQSGFDYANGEDGNDFISGGLGDDFLQGGAGADWIEGGAGNDTIYGGGTAVVPAGYAKTINYTHNGIDDTVLAGSQASTFGTIGSADTSADFLDGGDGDDTIVGNAGNDYLAGGRGNDQLDGSAGGDFIDGGGGLADFARYDGSVAGVVVRLDVGVGVGGDAQDDTLVSVEGLVGSGQQDFLIGGNQANFLFGQNGDDWLFGQGNADEMFGGAGIDQLIGGIGADRMTGGVDNDQFWTLAADFESGVFDTILDFGEVVGNFDFLRFEGIAQSQITFSQDGPNLIVSTLALGGSGGIVILNFSAAQIADQLIFA